jgi:deoxyribose-phosphate aldolase
MAKTPVLATGFELPLEPRLPRIGSVDAVAVEERAATLAKRSIKREAKLFALDLAVRMMDLTTLEGADTPGKVSALSSKGIRPDPADLSVPSVAAICVYPNLVPTAVERTRGTSVKVASVATASGDAHLKVILETGELGTYDNVRRASLLAMAAGADFIKTSTGKLPSAATLPVTLVMLEAIRDVYEETGRRVGMKPAGGIRQSKQAVQYLVQLHETLGPEWMTPDLYRLGASTLLNDVLMQIRKEKTGRYQSPDYFTVD